MIKGAIAQNSRWIMPPYYKNTTGPVALLPAAPGRNQIPCFTPAQRLARGIHSPAAEMMSRWISLAPPPKVMIDAVR